MARRGLALIFSLGIKLLRASSDADQLQDVKCSSTVTSCTEIHQETSLLAVRANVKKILAVNAEAEEETENLIRRLTSEEKFRFLRGHGWVNGSWDQVHGYYIGNAAAGLQDKHGIPSLNIQDGGQGFRTMHKKIVGQVTSWPCSLAVATAWSEEDMEVWARTMAKEFRAKGANVILGPGLNIHRVPRCGRNAEYASGESAYLGSRLTPRFVRGVQGGGVLATLKHYLNNNQETQRDDVNAIVDERTQQEVYLRPFAAGVRAGAASIMCSYNLVNGQHACGNPHILNDNLRAQYNFEGWVMSDWWAVHHTSAAEGGVDQEMPGTASGNVPMYLTDEFLQGLNMDKIDEMVRRILVMMRRHGIFENPVCQPGQCDHELYEVTATTADHQALAKMLATKSVLLLKNERQTLPLEANVTRIGVFGSACRKGNDTNAMLKQWDLGNYYYVGGSGRVIGPNPISIFDGIKEQCQSRGCEVIHAGDNVAKAASLATQVDAAIICAGASATEGRDRESLSVDQEAFMVEVSKVLRAKGVQRVIAATMTPGAVVMPWINQVDAAVNIFLGGDWTGTAIAAVLFGDSNPSAKSPITFPAHENDLPAPCTEVDCPYTEGLFVGYLALHDKPVTFPFGHGLSYTTFSYEHLSFGKPNQEGSGHMDTCANSAVCVHVSIANTGSREGREVLQLYLSFPDHVQEPPKQLKGFRSVDLAPSASANVTFAVLEEDLQIYDEEKKWTLADGHYTIYVGSSSRDLPLSAEFYVCEGKVQLNATSPCNRQPVIR